MNTQPLLILCATLGLTSMCGMIQQPAHDRPAKTDQASAEPADESKKNIDQPGRRGFDIRVNPDALRSRLNRSILRAEQMLERHKTALSKLDEGASPAEVLADMRLTGVIRPTANEQQNPQQDHPRQGRGKNAPPWAGNGLGDKPGPGADGGQGMMNPQQRDEVHGFLRENFPSLFEKLQQVAKQDKRNADRLLGRMGPQIREIMMLKDTQPDLAEIKIEEMHAGLAFVEASRVLRREMNDPDVSDSDRANAMILLRDLAGHRFDVQLRAKRFEIQRLESRLDDLKASVLTIEQRREQDIERMLKYANRPVQKTNSDKPIQSGDD